MGKLDNKYKLLNQFRFDIFISPVVKSDLEVRAFKSSTAYSSPIEFIH